jgi:hypothetical protein
MRGLFMQVSHLIPRLDIVLIRPSDDGGQYPSSSTGDMDSKRGRLIVSGLYADGLLDITWDPKENPE